MLTTVNKSKFIFATSTKADGNMSATFGLEQALNNRARFITSQGLNSNNLIILKQIHGNDVAVVNKSNIGPALTNTQIADADAMVTNDANLVLGIFTADCLPIFFYDEVSGVFGIAHAGRKGTVAGIAKNTVGSLRTNFGARSENINIAFGPCIHRCHYEQQLPQDEEKINEFRKLFPTAVEERDGKYYFDLIDANVSQLIATGIQPDNINSSASRCTADFPERYWSYHKPQKLEGVMLSIIGRNKYEQ